MTTYQIIYATDEPGPLCKARECAIASISPFEGRTVVAIASSGEGFVRAEKIGRSGMALRLEHAAVAVAEAA